MGKRERERKLTPAEKAKKKRVKREPTVDGIPADEFIQRNADLIWLLQSEMYEELHQRAQEQEEEQEDSQPEPARVDDELPS